MFPELHAFVLRWWWCLYLNILNMEKKVAVNIDDITHVNQLSHNSYVTELTPSLIYVQNSYSEFNVSPATGLVYVWY